MTRTLSGRASRIGGAALGGAATRNEVAALEQLRVDWKALMPVVEAQAGRLGDGRPRMNAHGRGMINEVAFQVQQNQVEVRAGLRDPLVSTHAMGRNTDPADLIRVGSGEQYQLKSGPFTRLKGGKLRHKKHEGMVLVVEADAVDQYAEYFRSVGEPELAEQLVSGFSSAELVELSSNPEGIKTQYLRNGQRQELIGGVRSGAGGGAAFAGAVSTVRNAERAIAGQISAGVAVRNVVVDAGKGGLRGGATQGAAVLLRQAAHRHDVKLLAKSGPASSVAAGLIESGCLMVSLANGRITGAEAMGGFRDAGLRVVSDVVIQRGVASLLARFPQAGLLGAAATTPLAPVVLMIVGQLAVDYAIGVLNEHLKDAQIRTERAEHRTREAKLMLIEARAAHQHLERLLAAGLKEKRAVAERVAAELGAAFGGGGSQVVKTKAIRSLSASTGTPLLFATLGEFREFVLASSPARPAELARMMPN